MKKAGWTDDYVRQENGVVSLKGGADGGAAGSLAARVGFIVGSPACR